MYGCAFEFVCEKERERETNRVECDVTSFSDFFYYLKYSRQQLHIQLGPIY